MAWSPLSEEESTSFSNGLPLTTIQNLKNSLMYLLKHTAHLTFPCNVSAKIRYGSHTCTITWELAPDFKKLVSTCPPPQIIYENFPTFQFSILSTLHFISVRLNVERQKRQGLKISTTVLPMTSNFLYLEPSSSKHLILC